MPYIRYTKKSNGREYASLASSSRDGKEVEQQYLGNLGLVIDKDKGLFKSRQRGLYHYSLEEGFSDPQIQELEKSVGLNESLILDFGDSYFLWEYIKSQSFYSSFRAILPEQADTLFSLLFFRILTDQKAYYHAQTWYQGNYTSLLFPKARFQSQRISEFLTEIGTEEVQREFFPLYIKSIYGKENTIGVLIDSSGLPNASKLSVTQLSNHNGDINLEARLIYVIDRKKGIPVYFRYCPGNIIDVTTLLTTLEELKQYSVEIDYAILDAGYFSETNVKELYKNKVRFITRLAPNRKIFKDVATIVLPGLMKSENLIRYGNRLVYICCRQIDVYSNKGFVYVGIDMDSRNQQIKRVAFNALDDKLSASDIDDKLLHTGLFALISSEKIPVNEVLPLYYTRQQIEQVFDIGKNNADLLPIRIHNEDTFRGHLMLTFLATVVLQKLQQNIIKKSKKSTA